MEGSRGCLIALWIDKLRLYWLDEYPREGFVVEGILFTPYQPGRFLYLYDWLLQPDHGVCGVQFSTGTDVAPVAQWLSSREGVRVVAESELFDIVFPGFSVERYYRDELDYQYIAEDVLEGKDGSFALALDLVGIEERDIHRLGAKRPAAGAELAVINPPQPSEEIEKERESAVRPKFHIPFLGRLFGRAGDSSGPSRENEGPPKS